MAKSKPGPMKKKSSYSEVSLTDIKPGDLAEDETVTIESVGGQPEDGGVFISHAEKNKQLVDALVDLLQVGMGLQHDDIFCTSLEGMGIPRGSNFIEFIKDRIKHPKLVIELLSPEYYDSTFCVCELGASWALSHTIFPILVPPLDYGDMKAVLIGVQAAKLLDPNALNDLRDRIQRLFRTNVSTAKWEAKREQFLEKAKKIIETAPPPSKVEYKKYAELQGRYRESQEELKRAMDEIDVLKKKNADLAAAKDRQEVDEILAEYSKEWERFEALRKKVRAAMRELPGVVKDALYYAANGASLRPSETNHDRIDDAIEEGYLVDTDGEISVNEDDPTVSAALEAVNALDTFLSRASQEFNDRYTDEFHHQPRIENSRFWDKQLR